MACITEQTLEEYRCWLVSEERQSGTIEKYLRDVRELMAMPNVRMLLGNHEYMMLNALDLPDSEAGKAPKYRRQKNLDLWYYNGGSVTHRYLKHIRKELRADIFAYLRALPLQADIEIGGEHYRLIHGGDPDDYPKFKSQDPDKTYYAVWHRRSKRAKPKDYTVIFGHTTTSHYQKGVPLCIWHGDKQIGIDCGSGFPETPDIWGRRYFGRLACLRLDDMKEFYSEEEYGKDK